MEDYSKLIKRTDWEQAVRNFEGLIVNATINLEHYKLALEHSKKKLAKMPDEVDEIVEEVTNDGNTEPAK